MKPYFEADGCAIYHGDCREILPQIEQCDAVISDPPYSETTHKGAENAPGSKLVDFAAISAVDVGAVIAAARPRRWCVFTCDYRHIPTLESTPPDGMRFVRFGVWVKQNPTPQFTGDRPGTGWEAVAILHASLERAGAMHWNGGGHAARWIMPKVQGEHPTQKPPALFSDFVRLFTDPGELVLDPFMGSGTTLVAARARGRRAIGIELEERYCEIAAKRLSQQELFAPAPVVKPEQGKLFGGAA